MLPKEIPRFLTLSRVFSRDEVLSRPSPVPAASGVYGWWFRDLPALIDMTGATSVTPWPCCMWG